MRYLVERYLPGVSRRELERQLEPLEAVTEQMRRDGTAVRYLGSTILPQEEACFCQFEGPSEVAIAEANRQAGVGFDRIVLAIAVGHSVSTSPGGRNHD